MPTTDTTSLDALQESTSTEGEDHLARHERNLALFTKVIENGLKKAPGQRGGFDHLHRNSAEWVRGGDVLAAAASLDQDDRASLGPAFWRRAQALLDEATLTALRQAVSG